MVAQPNYGLSTDTTLGGNSPSDIISPSEKAIKTYVDNNTQWGSITGTLSSQTDLSNALDGKQDTLVSGTNIKTINSTSLLGNGNINVGTVMSVNNVQPDVNGNVTVSIVVVDGGSA